MSPVRYNTLEKDNVDHSHDYRTAVELLQQHSCTPLHEDPEAWA